MQMVAVEVEAGGVACKGRTTRVAYQVGREAGRAYPFSAVTFLAGTMLTQITCTLVSMQSPQYSRNICHDLDVYAVSGAAIRD